MFYFGKNFQVIILVALLVIWFYLAKRVETNFQTGLTMLNSFGMVSMLLLQRDYLISLDTTATKAAWLTASLFGMTVFTAYSGILTSTMISRYWYIAIKTYP